MHLIVSKALLDDKRISVTARLVLAQLLDHRNKQTAQCNPKRQTLADELAISLYAVKRALRELYKAGILHSKQRHHTNFYEIEVAQVRATMVAQVRATSTRASLYEPIQDEHTGGVYGSSSTAKRRESPPVKNQTQSATQPPIPRKPSARAGREALTFKLVRQALDGLAPLVHLPSPDDDLVWQVIGAAQGASGEEIQATLVALWKREHLRDMRSWGLIPIKIGACFRRATA